jgi:zinc transport system permease protein
MMEMLTLFQNPFVVSSIIAGLLAGIIGGTVGTFVVVKRISFISGSISHSVIAGIGLFVWLERVMQFPHVSPLIGALCAAIMSALIIARAGDFFQEREDSLIAMTWAAGMAIGIVFIAKTPGYTAELSNILIGNILWISRQDLMILGTLTVVSMLFVVKNFQQLKLLMFDQDQASLSKIRIKNLYSALLILVAITVVALTQVVGIVLVMTMLTLPQMLAGLFCKRLSSMICWSIIFSVVCTAAGLTAAFVFDVPPGASITLTSVILYAMGIVVRRGIGKRGIRTLGTL